MCLKFGHYILGIIFVLISEHKTILMIYLTEI